MNTPGVEVVSASTSSGVTKSFRWLEVVEVSLVALEEGRKAVGDAGCVASWSSPSFSVWKYNKLTIKESFEVRSNVSCANRFKTFKSF